ncbi:metallophosphoesterase [Paenibacillus pinihumi]|uniref:metallophosphoesterase n=1 Tax=Paenibacillus pinihumi TaxID=669462 RepID=UPI00040BA715|nr:metallophosphoesterase [Paenibacillus pinihumi]
MNIGVISDLHVDINEAADGPSIEEALLEVSNENKLDALIIAGDISNDVNRSLAVLSSLKAQSGIPVLFVPGNHDYWSKVNGIKDTWQVYKQFQTYEGNLCERPFELDNGWVVIGSSGWYDYTMGDSKYSTEQFDQMQAMDRMWHDGHWVNWGMSNRDVHQYFKERLENELEAYRGKPVIMVTHMLSHSHFKVPTPHPVWEYFNAFLGSTEYAELYRKYEVRYGIMGHVHYRKKLDYHGIELICACLGYRREWRQPSAVQEIRNCMQIISV